LPSPVRAMRKSISPPPSRMISDRAFRPVINPKASNSKL